MIGLVAASLPDDAEVLVADGQFTSTLFPLLVQERRGVAVRSVPFERRGRRGHAPHVAGGRRGGALDGRRGRRPGPPSARRRASTTRASWPTRRRPPAGSTSTARSSTTWSAAPTSGCCRRAARPSWRCGPEAAETRHPPRRRLVRGRRHLGARSTARRCGSPTTPGGSTSRPRGSAGTARCRRSSCWRRSASPAIARPRHRAREPVPRPPRTAAVRLADRVASRSRAPSEQLAAAGITRRHAGRRGAPLVPPLQHARGTRTGRCRRASRLELGRIARRRPVPGTGRDTAALRCTGRGCRWSGVPEVA